MAFLLKAKVSSQWSVLSLSPNMAFNDLATNEKKRRNAA
jgi:hypothetical protein